MGLREYVLSMNNLVGSPFSTPFWWCFVARLDFSWKPRFAKAAGKAVPDRACGNPTSSCKVLPCEARASSHLLLGSRHHAWYLRREDASSFTNSAALLGLFGPGRKQTSHLGSIGECDQFTVDRGLADPKVWGQNFRSTFPLFGLWSLW